MALVEHVFLNLLNLNYQVNNVLEGRPPSELQEYYDNIMGEVTYVISKTFGVISFDQVVFNFYQTYLFKPTKL